LISNDDFRDLSIWYIDNFMKMLQLNRW